MKKIKFTGKLSLNKETVAKLNNEQMSKVNGGSVDPTGSGCTGSRYCVTNFGCPPPTNGCPTMLVFAC